MVKGPATLKLSGHCRILGCNISNTTIKVNAGKILPIEIQHGSKLERIIEEGGDFWTATPNLAGTEMWRYSASRVVKNAKLKKGFKILVIGSSDAGKTTFCTFLANLCLEKGLVPCIVDSDVGQSDLAPPGVIGAVVIQSQTIDLRNVELGRAHFEFIGSISPSKVEESIIKQTVAAVKVMVQRGKPDVFIVNSDGYVSGSGIPYKLRMAKSLPADAIISLGRIGLLGVILKRLIGSNLIRCRSSPYAKKTRQERISRRASQYSRFIGRGSAIKKLVDVKLVYRQHELLAIDLSILEVGTFVALAANEIIVGYGCVQKLAPDTITIKTGMASEEFDTIFLSDIRIREICCDNPSLREPDLAETSSDVN